MPKYIYVGVTSSGKQTKGEIEANSKAEAISLLRKNKTRIVTIRVKPLQLKLNFTIGSGVKLPGNQQIYAATGRNDLGGASPCPVPRYSGVAKPKIKFLPAPIQQISGDIQVGSTLADALGKHTKIFNQLFCNMVAAGEASGNLDGVLLRLAEYQEKAEGLRRKIKTAMTYPVIVGIIADFGWQSVMLTVIVPKFAKMFSDLGGELPLPTLIIMGISKFMQHYILIMAGHSHGRNYSIRSDITKQKKANSILTQ